MVEQDRLNKYLSENLQFRLSCMTSSQVCKDICERHDFNPLVTLGLSQCITASLLLVSLMDEESSISLQFQGNGPLHTLFSEANYNGDVRAYASYKSISEQEENQLKNVEEAIGTGSLLISQNRKNWKSVQNGTVALTGDGIGQDIVHFLNQSQQIPSLLLLGTNFDTKSKISTCGGLLIEALPGADDSVLEQLENNLVRLGNISYWLSENLSIEEIVKQYSFPYKLSKITHDIQPRHNCKCSIDRVSRSIKLLGKKEIESMIAKGEILKIQCEFCMRRYSIDVENLEKILVDIDENQNLH